MSHAHDHHHGKEQSGRRLVIALLLNVGITVAQVVGGLLSGSLALLADAAHNASDAASIGIAYRARQIAQRRASPKYTFGYNRAEVIGAMINLTTLFVIALFLAWQAAGRFLNPRPVEGTTMLLVGGIAFVEDALSVWVLYRGEHHKLNVQAVMIHLVGDTLATLGVLLPNGMDGVGGLTQPPIEPGETFVYEFPVEQHGTFMYHSHHNEMSQIAMGMTGMIVFHPRSPSPEYSVDRDFAVMLHEWRINPGTYRPDPNEMSDFNILTMNARAFPGTEPLVMETGQRVRIRLGNLGPMDNHPIHLHGHYFEVAATDGGRIPRSARWPETTVIIGVGQTRDIEFTADRPGDWAFHCHMTHHIMNQMGHDLPNMTGVEPRGFDARARALLPAYMSMGMDGMGEMGQHIDMGHMEVPENSIPMVGAMGPFGYITMGGMFSIVKIREQVEDWDNVGWYNHPPHEVAGPASMEQLGRDDIDVGL